MSAVAAARTAAFWAFARERHAAYLRRAAGMPAPWTADRILATWRFTNVYRSLDPTTGAFYAATAGRRLEDLAFASLVFRAASNRRSVLERFGLPLKETEDAQRWFKALKEASDRDGGGVCPTTHATRPWYQTERMVLEAAAAPCLVQDGPASTATRLNRLYGVGPFYVTQVIADLTGAPPAVAPWPPDSYVSPGRGAQSALVYLGAGEMPSPQTQKRLVAGILADTYDGLVRDQEDVGGPRLTYVDVEHSLCEFYKYVSLFHNIGRPNVKRYAHASG